MGRRTYGQNCEIEVEDLRSSSGRPNDYDPLVFAIEL